LKNSNLNHFKIFPEKCDIFKLNHIIGKINLMQYSPFSTAWCASDRVPPVALAEAQGCKGDVLEDFF